METCDLDAALIRWTPLMPPTSACRIDLHEVFKRPSLEKMQEESLGERETAAISHADEKDPINRNTS